MSWKARAMFTTEGPEVIADTKSEAKDLAYAMARDHGSVIGIDFTVTEVEEGASDKE